MEKQTPTQGLLSLFSKKTSKDGIVEYPPAPVDPSGEDFDFDDEKQMARRYPELWKRFGW